MKVIVVPTDFSAASQNAMNYAAQMAKTVGASLYLVNVYQLPVSMDDMPGMVVPSEDLKEASDANLDRMKELLHQNFPDIEVKSESILGDLVGELTDLGERLRPYAIVGSTHHTTGVERLLFGKSGMALLKIPRIPVVVIPETYTECCTTNTAMAYDGTDSVTRQQRVKAFIEPLHTQLHLVHIRTTDREADPKLENTFTELKPVCHRVKDDEFVHGVQTFIQDHRIDMLIIFPHKHSLMERFFLKIHSAELLERVSIPLVSLYED
jgi:nucleotide-binding universal stress UspA family protein